jgi:hypothetical protein
MDRRGRGVEGRSGPSDLALGACFATRAMMAIFIPGMECALCEIPVRSGDEAVMFSAFVADRSDPLFIFSDSVVHASCFARHPLSAEALRWQGETVRRGTPTARICVACGRPILDPDDYFTTGLLSRAPDNPLFEFNFLHLHQSHTESWPRFDEFRRRIEAAQAEGGQRRGPTLISGTLRWVANK